MQANPQAIQPILQQIAMNNPAIVQLFAQHPEQLAQLLGIPEAAVNLGALADLLGAEVVELTAEEEAAVQRVSSVHFLRSYVVLMHMLVKLMALGFGRDTAVEAYMACDKNEELAANYLFEGGWDDAE